MKKNINKAKQKSKLYSMSVMGSRFLYKILSGSLVSLKSCIALVCLVCPIFSVAQDWDAWSMIYKDKDISVEVSFKVEPNGCIEKKMNLIQYRVTGNLSSFSDYIIWNTDFTDCSGQLYFQEHSLDISTGNDNSGGNSKAYGDTWTYPNDAFLAKNIVRKFYNVRRTSSPSKNSGPQTPQYSTSAVAIDGESKVGYDFPTTLTVNGGQLGTGANWVWYANNCGDERIGEGESIVVTPQSNTTYYVRAEGADTTKCVKKTLYIISIPPDYVSGGGEIRIDQPVTLRVNGGTLTPGSNWVWYENTCGGKKIGEGQSLTVRPIANTTYNVRAEGSSNTTECVTADVSLLSRDPVSIFGPTNVTIGQSATLRVVGGYLGDRDNWIWYENTCGGKRIGTGSEISVTPIEKVSYYVRSEGKNPNTNCANLTIESQIPLSSESTKKSPYINKFDFQFVDGKVKIKYNIKNAKQSDIYDISIKGYRNAGVLNLSSVSGSLSNIKGRGNKTIIWDAVKDGYSFNDKIVFNITGSVKERIPLMPRLGKSLVFPGWGDMNLRNKKSRLWLGITGYTLLISSVYFNIQANQNYDSYKKSGELAQRDQLHKTATTQNYISLACAATSGLFWTIDLAGIVSKRQKVRRNLTYESSKYYYMRSQNKLNTFSSPQIINVK